MYVVLLAEYLTHCEVLTYIYVLVFSVWMTLATILMYGKWDHWKMQGPPTKSENLYEFSNLCETLFG